MLLSVIIPVFNEEKTIIQLLKKISKQKFFFIIEILVSDDGSTDSTNFLLKKTNFYLIIYIHPKKILEKAMLLEWL
jgi:glycosyltransferase involved in cell wall biosynthesis